MMDIFLTRTNACVCQYAKDLPQPVSSHIIPLAQSAADFGFLTPAPPRRRLHTAHLLLRLLSSSLGFEDIVCENMKANHLFVNNNFISCTSPLQHDEQIFQ